MSRRKQGPAFEEDEPELDISSLIDVCFLLLIYFLVTTTIQPREADLPMTLPSANPSDTPPDIQPMLIQVDDSGGIIVNKEERLDQGAVGKQRELPKLSNRLQLYKELASGAGTEPLVQISVSGEAPQSSVIDVINCLVGLQIDKVTFTDFSN
ncbi:biopolymer transport protein ExbD [Rubritalea squalenifaciens DSM 18772]|uniref:Biopolymer transport protein ExbD n=1 Tax=Rubritalea squalenifaciens DSM 18772 TaxID=1123071 RepID=A0A1M6DL08_9BACT|nr:biopolymer transporter ExbD [Rubritalea squalenifaciens]SHI73841.1 biopolymer transport protein ExbD [Rubritalea squalenifaciens DSM 18772]